MWQTLLIMVSRKRDKTQGLRFPSRRFTAAYSFDHEATGKYDYPKYLSVMSQLQFSTKDNLFEHWALYFARKALRSLSQKRKNLGFNFKFYLELFTWQELESPNATTDEFNLSVNCHLANLVLPPKKGTAIMWYNNFIDPDSGLLGSVDRYSLHGGCDVLKGEKWIANNWLTAPTKYSRHIKSVYDSGF